MLARGSTLAGTPSTEPTNQSRAHEPVTAMHSTFAGRPSASSPGHEQGGRHGGDVLLGQFDQVALGHEPGDEHGATFISSPRPSTSRSRDTSKVNDRGEGARRDAFNFDGTWRPPRRRAAPSTSRAPVCIVRPDVRFHRPGAGRRRRPPAADVRIAGAEPAEQPRRRQFRPPLTRDAAGRRDAASIAPPPSPRANAAAETAGRPSPWRRRPSAERPSTAARRHARSSRARHGAWRRPRAVLLLERTACSSRVSIVTARPASPPPRRSVVGPASFSGSLPRRRHRRDASQPPVLFVERERPAARPPAEERPMLVSILAIAITTLVVILAMSPHRRGLPALVSGEAMALLQRLVERPCRCQREPRLTHRIPGRCRRDVVPRRPPPHLLPAHALLENSLKYGRRESMACPCLSLFEIH